MSREHSMNKATFVLKVGMHCNACRKKVYKLLHKIEGVDQVHIDAEEKMVIVSGNVDPAILLKTLKKAGKSAELWGSEDGKKDDQLKDGKGQQEDNIGKPQNGGGGRRKNLKLPQLKGLKFPFGRKDKKSVKFDLRPENNADEERDGDEEKDHNEEAADHIHEDNEDNQNQGDDIDGDHNQGDDIDDSSEDNQSQGGGSGESGGGNNNNAAQPMFCPYMMAQGFQCMHLGGRMGNMPHAPKSHMMEEHKMMMMSGQAGSTANPPPPNGYGTPCAPHYVDQYYTNMFSDENPNACSIM